MLLRVDELGWKALVLDVGLATRWRWAIENMAEARGMCGSDEVGMREESGGC